MRAPLNCDILEAGSIKTPDLLERTGVMESTPTRILLADDDLRVRSALRTLLQQEPGQIVLRESSDVTSLAIQIQEFQPDLVLLDWELPGRPAAAVLLAWHSLARHPKVIVLSRRPESETSAMAAGADAFVSKGEPPERLLRAFRELVQKVADETQRDGG
jgi:DNA-binding NarL/FixJ family response regulator